LLPLSDIGLIRQRRPVVTYALIALNALVFLYELTLGGDRSVFYYTYGLIPDELTSGRDFQWLQTQTGLVDIATPLPTWGTIFTAMFIHGGLLHIGSNMLYLWVFGDNVEDRMGHVPYLVFYLAAGVAASWAQIAVDLSSQTPTIGASGAVAGVLGAYFMMFPYSRIRTLTLTYIITVIQIPAMLLLGIWLLLQFWSGLGTFGPSGGGGIAYWAHIGGFLAGMATVALYRILTRQRVWQGHRPF